MVARPSAEPQGRPNKFTDVGVVGRKTGLMVKDTGRRDSAGLEDMDAFFSPTGTPKKGARSPGKTVSSYKTKLQAAMQSNEGITKSTRDSSSVLASRKSLLAQHRSPQKTYLKSPAVRVQTPRKSNLDSPSRVQRMLSFTELDADFEDENLNIGMGEDAGPPESPTEIARPAKRKGLTQQTRRKTYEVEDADVVEDEDEEDEPGVPDDQDDGQDYGGFGGGFGDDSFGQDEPMDEQELLPYDNLGDVEEEEDIYGQQPSPQPPKKSRGRPKASSQSVQPEKPKKVTKRAGSTQPVPKRPRTTSAAPRGSSQPAKIIERKEIPHPADMSMMDSEIRRSTRIRVAPLAHWKNERIVYELEGRRASGPALPKIKEIVRIDTPPQPARARSVGRKRKTRAESDSESDDESDAGEVYTSIKSYEDGSTIEDYRVAVSKSAINPHLLQGSKIRFEKLFQDGSYMASGVIDISVGGAKGAKPTRHCFMSFAVMSGRVEVKLNRTAFVIGKGGVFVVPRGNVYSIKNVGDKSCRLFFSQAVEEGLPEEAEQKESED